MTPTTCTEGMKITLKFKNRKLEEGYATDFEWLP